MVPGPGPVNCCWLSPAESFLVSGPVGTHDQIFISSKTVCVWKCGLLFDNRRGLVFLSRRHVCCIVSVAVFTQRPGSGIWNVWTPYTLPLYYNEQHLCEIYTGDLSVHACAADYATPKQQTVTTTVVRLPDRTQVEASYASSNGSMCITCSSILKPRILTAEYIYMFYMVLTLNRERLCP